MSIARKPPPSNHSTGTVSCCGSAPALSLFTHEGEGSHQRVVSFLGKFTGKERDSETGLYYYGARYLDSKTSRWLSADAALGDYVPGAPVNDEARKRNGNLPGMGGVFNTVNFHLYHYAGNNPVKYVDPNGQEIKWNQGDGVTDTEMAEVKAVETKVMTSDTEAGRRYKELYDDPNVTITINVTKTGMMGVNVAEEDQKNAGNGIGRNPTVNFGISEKGKYYPGGGPEITLDAALVHEVSGHAYGNAKGISHAFKDKVLEEKYACAIENQCRYANRQHQRKTYSFENGALKVPVPQYMNTSARRNPNYPRSMPKCLTAGNSQCRIEAIPTAMRGRKLFPEGGLIKWCRENRA